MNSSLPKLGLKENLGQFSLLVLINAFVGAMIGLERSILPEIAQKEFFLSANTAVLSFIVFFGISKAIMNYFAGSFSDRWGRKTTLILGWAVTVPVPFILMWAPNWNWILFANILLGIGQGLTWSTTVIMKIDIVGSKRRGLAMGLNEFAGYLAVSLSALATSYIASKTNLRPQPFYLGLVFVFFGLFLSIFFVRETSHHVIAEGQEIGEKIEGISAKKIFLQTSFLDKNLSSITQGGFFNNLNDGMVWGIFPIYFSIMGISLAEIGQLAAIYPAVWGICQLFTGHLSDKFGRKWLMAWGMWVQALGIALTILFKSFLGFSIGGVLLGLGTAMVYPTFLAAIGDVTGPSWSARAVGVYRLWRDLGYAVGALVAGITADFLGIRSAICLVAILTAVSGIIIAVRMKETLKR